MAIFGAHMLFYSREAEAVRKLLADAFGFEHVDAHDGWLIFALPPAEIGVHPGEGPNFESGMRHETAFMCDDLESTINDLRAKGVEIEGQPQAESYGTTVTMKLPGDLCVMLYQPLHKLAIQRG